MRSVTQVGVSGLHAQMMYEGDGGFTGDPGIMQLDGNSEQKGLWVGGSRERQNNTK